MVSENNVLELLIQLAKTNKPSDKLELIMKFALLNLRDCDQSNLSELINTYQEQIDKKKKQGLEASKFRVYKKDNFKNTNKKGYDVAMFVTDYTAHQHCIVCGETISSNAAFRKRFDDGHYDDNHALPSCCPDPKMLNNKKYIKYMENSK